MLAAVRRAESVLLYAVTHCHVAKWRSSSSSCKSSGHTDYTNRRLWFGAHVLFRKCGTGRATFSSANNKAEILVTGRGTRVTSRLAAGSSGAGSSHAADSKPREGRGVNERKRQARQAKDWAAELTKLSLKEIDNFARYADMAEETVEAIKLAKALGPRAKNGWRRQLSYVGGLLRNLDAGLLEVAYRAAREGDLQGLAAMGRATSMAASPSALDSGAGPPEGRGEAFFAEEDEEEEEEEDEGWREEGSGSSTEEGEETDGPDVAILETIERWHTGLLAGTKGVTHEVYAIDDAAFDRQVLRRLVRMAAREQSESEKQEEVGAEDSGRLVDRGGSKQTPSPTTKANRELRNFLLDLAARQSHYVAL